MKVYEAAAVARDFVVVRQFFRDRNLLRDTAPNCSEAGCGRAMTEVKAERKSDGVLWRCPAHKGHKVSICSNSFFMNSNLMLGDIFWVMYLWSHQTPVHTCESMLNVGYKTIIQW